MSRSLISEITFGENTYELKDAIARSAISNLNSFEYTICDQAENTPFDVSFQPGSSDISIVGTLVPSANTKYRIYLVPSNSEDSKNAFYEYITVERTELVNDVETPVYYWEKIGSTDINLSGYLTTTAAENTYAPKASPVFSDSISLGRKANTTVGENSFAVGNDVTASGRASHAEGESTIASGVASHASGKYNVSSVFYPDWVAGTRYEVGDKVLYSGVGYRCIGAIIDVNSFTPSKWEQLPSNTYEAFIIGNGTGENKRSNAFSVDWDGSFRAYGDEYTFEFSNAISMGRKANTTVSLGSFAVGKDVTASAGQAHAEGWLTEATGHTAHAEGTKAHASGPISHAEGMETVAYGQDSHAEGYGTYAFGHHSHASGRFNSIGTAYPGWVAGTSYDVGDMVVWQNAGWRCIEANSDDAFSPMVKWKLAVSNSPEAFVIGNGTDDDNRSNAFSVDWDGSFHAYGDHFTLGSTSITESMLADLIDLANIPSAEGVSF